MIELKESTFIFISQSMDEQTEQLQTSLGSITEHLINTLKTNQEIEIELSKACKLIDAPKRRLYDVVNVLIGIGLIERCGKSRIKWTSRESKTKNAQTFLEQREQELLQFSKELDQYLDDMLNSEAFSQYAWVSDEDVAALKTSPQSKIFALKGPKNLSITLEQLDNGNHQMICKAEETISWIPVGQVQNEANEEPNITSE